MERRGWWVLLGVGASLAVGIAIWRFSTVDEGPPPEARLPAETSSGLGPSHPPVLGRPEADGPEAGDEEASAPRASATGSEASAPEDPGGRGHSVGQDVPREVNEAEQSSGWRLGATRRRIAILGPRIERVRTRITQLEEAGRGDVAERQRGVLERYVARLDELREDETRFAREAAADGSAADAAQGYEESETEHAARGGTSSIIPASGG